MAKKHIEPPKLSEQEIGRRLLKIYELNGWDVPDVGGLSEEEAAAAVEAIRAERVWRGAKVLLKLADRADEQAGDTNGDTLEAKK